LESKGGVEFPAGKRASQYLELGGALFVPLLLSEGNSRRPIFFFLKTSGSSLFPPFLFFTFSRVENEFLLGRGSMVRPPPPRQASYLNHYSFFFLRFLQICFLPSFPLKRKAHLLVLIDSIEVIPVGLSLLEGSGTPPSLGIGCRETRLPFSGRRLASTEDLTRSFSENLGRGAPIFFLNGPLLRTASGILLVPPAQGRF